MLAAITYDIRPGHEDEIAEIFSAANFRRADTPILRDEDGTEAGRIHGTGLFIRDGFMVRVIHHEGDIAAVGRHMAGQKGVKEAERRLLPYLATPRDTEAPERFQGHFQSSLMTTLQDRELSTRPGKIAAMAHRIKPGKGAEIAEFFRRLPPAPDPSLRGGDGEVTGAILGVGLFLRGETMVRAVRYRGGIEDLARFMADWPQRPKMEEMLAPYLDEDRPATRAEFLARFRENTLRRISMLTTADPAYADRR